MLPIYQNHPTPVNTLPHFSSPPLDFYAEIQYNCCMIRAEGQIRPYGNRRLARPEVVINFNFGVAVLMRAVGEYYYRLSVPAPDLTPWPDQQEFWMGPNLLLGLRQPQAGEPANLKVSLKMPMGGGRKVEWTLMAAEVPHFDAQEADRLLKDLLFDLTDEGRRHPVLRFRGRHALFSPFPRLQTCHLPAGTEVRVKNKHRGRNMPQGNSKGMIKAEIDQSKMVLLYYWRIEPPEHLYLVEIHPERKKDRTTPPRWTLDLVYADYELEVLDPCRRLPQLPPPKPTMCATTSGS